jgi:hypothetical protein
MGPGDVDASADRVRALDCVTRPMIADTRA